MMKPYGSHALWIIVLVAGCGKQDAPKLAVAPPGKESADKSPAKEPERLPGEVAPLVMPPVQEPKAPSAAKAQVAAKRQRIKPSETVALSAEAFAGEIRKGTQAAAKKFEPVLVELTGVVRQVGARDHEAFVTLDSGPDALGVMCLLAQEKEPWARISKGQKVKVRGQWPDDYWQPALEMCELIELGPNPALEVRAEVLAEEFAKNKEAARAKYQEKTLIVEGLIVHAVRNELGAVRLFLKGAGDTRVDCGFDAPQRAEAESRAIGQRLRVVGEFSALEALQEPALRGCRVITTK